MQIPLVRFAAEFFAISQTLLWEWLLQYPRRGRDIHHYRTENQFPAPGLEGEASCRGENGIFDDSERLVARASSTCVKLRGRLAEERGLPGQINANLGRSPS